MNVAKVGLINTNSKAIVAFKENGRSSDTEYENPVSRSTERNLAVWGSLGASVALGVIAAGLTSCVAKTEEVTEKSFSGFYKAKKIPILVGAGVAALTLIVGLPAKLYNTKVNAFVKQKEMDVFTRDRDLKTDLTEQVNDEVKNPEVTLDKKLDDNLKLQVGNKGAAVAIAAV